MIPDVECDASLAQKMLGHGDTPSKLAPQFDAELMASKLFLACDPSLVCGNGIEKKILLLVDDVSAGQPAAMVKCRFKGLPDGGGGGVWMYVVEVKPRS